MTIELDNVTRNGKGLLRLSDIYAALKPGDKKMPHRFMITQQARDLIAELAREGKKKEFIVNATKSDIWGCDEFATAYIAWCEPAFMLMMMRNIYGE